MQLTAQNEIDIMRAKSGQDTKWIKNKNKATRLSLLEDDDVAGINISARKQFVNKKLHQMRVGGVVEMRGRGGGGRGKMRRGEMHLWPAS